METLVIITKCWKQLECPSISEWVHSHNKLILSNEKNELLIHVTTWMDLKNILLSENTKGHMTTVPLIRHFGKNKDTGQESDQWLPGATRRREQRTKEDENFF